MIKTKIKWMFNTIKLQRAVISFLLSQQLYQEYLFFGWITFTKYFIKQSQQHYSPLIFHFGLKPELVQIPHHCSSCKKPY